MCLSLIVSLWSKNVVMKIIRPESWEVEQSYPAPLTTPASCSQLKNWFSERCHLLLEEQEGMGARWAKKYQMSRTWAACSPNTVLMVRRSLWLHVCFWLGSSRKLVAAGFELTAGEEWTVWTWTLWRRGESGSFEFGLRTVRPDAPVSMEQHFTFAGPRFHFISIIWELWSSQSFVVHFLSIASRVENLAFQCGLVLTVNEKEGEKKQPGQESAVEVVIVLALLVLTWRDSGMRNWDNSKTSYDTMRPIASYGPCVCRTLCCSS